MRIDAHQHFWRPARGDYGWLTPELTTLYRDFEPDLLRPLLDEAGIETTILVQAAPTEPETEYLLEIARRTPWIAGVVGWTDLAAADAPARVERLANTRTLVGLRPMLQDIPDLNWILRPELGAGISAMAAHELVFDALVRETQLPVILELATRFPSLAIVLDHAGKPAINGNVGKDWREAIVALADCPNVSVKLSGLLTEGPPGLHYDTLAPIVEALLENFDCDRILWGSDWPVLTTVATYHGWVAITEKLIRGLDAKARDAIWGGTAARVYGLQEAVNVNGDDE